MKTLPLVALLAATGVGLPALPARWLHNPRERTAAAIEAWKRHDYQAADRDLEQALESGDQGAPTLFNAGTGRLGAGTPGAALPLLTRAADAAATDPAATSLRPEALYNLGNAYLATGDAAKAAESYRAALRLRPGHRAAKHNLELALRQLEHQRQQSPQQPKQSQQGNGDEQGGGGEGRPQDQEHGSGAQPSPPQGAQPPASGLPQQGQMGRSPRLPRFNPQKDMSADQAAALLEAVENLEREQRREQAERERVERARSSTEEDW